MYSAMTWLYTYSDPNGMILHDVVYQRVIELEYYERVNIMYQVAEGMKYLDERNVIISWRQWNWMIQRGLVQYWWMIGKFPLVLFYEITNLIGLLTQQTFTKTLQMYIAIWMWSRIARVLLSILCGVGKRSGTLTIQLLFRLPLSLRWVMIADNDNC